MHVMKIGPGPRQMRHGWYPQVAHRMTWIRIPSFNFFQSLSAV